MTSIAITTAATPAKAALARGPSRRKAKAQSASNTETSPASDKSASKPTLPISKAALVIKLLSRAKGATVEELIAETAWQPHSVRAYFSGLRKKGHLLVREQRKGGDHAYRIGAPATDAPSVMHVTEAAAEPVSANASASTGA